jgi:hypothetical protein
VLHPYDHIDSIKYQTNPEVIVWLNDKHNLEEITPYAPKTYTNNLKYSQISSITQFPCVLKA